MGCDNNTVGSIAINSLNELSTISPWKRSGYSLALALMISMPLTVFGQTSSDLSDAGNKLSHRNFDARIDQSIIRTIEPAAEQQASLSTLRQRLPELQVYFDPQSGVTRTLSNRNGFLSTPSNERAELIANRFIESNVVALGLLPSDIASMQETDQVNSALTGIHHFYYQQQYLDIPVYNAQIQTHIDERGRVIIVNNSFVRNIGSKASLNQVAFDPVKAIEAAIDFLNIKPVDSKMTIESIGSDARQTTRITATSISLEPIVASLVWLPLNNNEVTAAWNFQIHRVDQQAIKDMTVDARSSQILTVVDWVSDGSYRVFEQPEESPNHSGGRVLVVNPEDLSVSPLGWHDNGTTEFTIMRGNNVHAYDDRNSNNSPPSSQPSCSAGLLCDFPLNLGQDPNTYTNAALANVFYWSNIIHDIQYLYGFDEAAGNFQQNNFGNGGNGGDFVRAEAQDGSSTNNANFSSPPDGARGRMQMFLWDITNPRRDGDLDAGIIVHEYGHGISTRQVGGPSNSSCLGNRQQAGEGWSDFFALAYTSEAGDLGTDVRGIGTYALGQPVTGRGIRALPYSTDQSVNDWTYSSIEGMAVPHGIGSVWAQALWEVYWALVDIYGLDPDLANAVAGAGNHRAMLYVNEGLKLTACSPTLIDARNGVVQAAASLNNGVDECAVWQAFADYGLGVDAFTSGANATTATNGFSVPSQCDGTPPPPPVSCPAGSIDFNNFDLTAFANQDNFGVINVSADGSTLSLEGNRWRASTETYTLTPNTMVEFAFASANQGEIHGIAMESDNLVDSDSSFRVFGSQNFGAVVEPQYSGNGDFQIYNIPVGETLTGNNFRLVFVNDDDSSATDTNSEFRCVRVFEDQDTGGGQCSVDIDFEDGAVGWSNSASSTCTTGAYTLGTPSEQSTAGVITQVGGDNTTGSGVAIFSAANTSLGNADIDGGNCILESPVWTVDNDSTLEAFYFHGQRDTGDDAGGDFFSLEVSTDGGASFIPFVSIGDVESSAAWTPANTQIPAGSQVQLRMQAADGAGPGDIIEAGIDDVSICPN